MFAILGHQKKFMLAIDRFKKMNSAKQSDSLEPSISRVECPSSTEVKPAYCEPMHLPGTPRSGGRSQEVVASIHPHESSSGENSAKQTRPKIPENKSGPQARNVIRLPPQTPFVSPSAQATHAQSASHAAQALPPSAPEMIAIQVNRAAGPRTGSIKERSSDRSDPQHVMYKSFHGRPSREFSGVLVETEGETTPTNDRSMLSLDEAEELANRFRPQVAPKPDCDSFRRASASGIMNAAEIASALQMQSRRFFPHDVVGYRDQLVEFSARNCEGPQLSPGVSYGSAPSTPSHSTLVESSSSPRPKKAVPPPPKRSNSIKDKNTSNSASSRFANARNSPDPSHRDPSKSENTAAHQLALGDSTSHATPSGSAGAKPKLGGCASSSSELDNPLTRVIARLEWKDDQVVRPSKMKEFGRTAEVCPPAPSSSVSNVAVHLNRSNSDCNTLPFANENIGTIKQRTPAKATVAPVATGDLHDRPGCSQDLAAAVATSSSHSLRRLSQGSGDIAMADGGRLQRMYLCTSLIFISFLIIVI